MDHGAYRQARLAVGAAVLLTASCSGSDDPGPGEVAFAKVDVADKPLLYTSDSSGNLDMWVSAPDGSNATRLTTAPGDEGFGTWSPDGRQIAFVVSTGEGHIDLYVANADGTGLTQVTADAGDGSESWPVWSPDGTQLLYTVTGPDDPGGEFGTVKTINVDGTGEQALADNAGWADWSPDGTRIVYTQTDPEQENLLIRVMDVDGGNDKTISPESLRAPNEPTWSPDGTRIALSAAYGDPNSENPADWDYDLLVMNADGSDLEKVADLAGNEHYPPAWSPDGSKIAFTADGVELEAEIMIVDLRTDEVTPVTDNEEIHDITPDWRPTP
jgi:TolB protein